jgi:hypothetical protein
MATPPAPAPAATPSPVVPPAAAITPTGITPPHGVPPTVTPSGYAPSTATPRPPTGGDRRLVLVLAGVAALVLVVLVALVASGGGGGEEDDVAGSTTRPPTSQATETTQGVTSTAGNGSVTTLAPGSEGLNGLVVTAIPFDLGDSRVWDALAARCAAGGLQSCDALQQQSPRGSLFEEFGGTCGDRADFDRTTKCEDRDL